ncbi:MAG: hypothetical protein O9345_16145 [Burkholderiaceae bacterium]|nr:hypothetical protein [Burkholderiales bacterium]MCZ8339657.1 hypothetical protein [Burkholderiaceae bacterium]
MTSVSVVAPIGDRQPRSKDSPRVADRQLPLVEKGEPVDVDPALVRRQRSMLGAIQLCLQVAGIADKEAHLALGIDAGHWSRILSGAAHFPLDRLGPLMDMAGNDAPLQWLAHSRGYELRPLETTLEREVRELREELAEEKRKARWMADIMAGRPA